MAIYLNDKNLKLKLYHVDCFELNHGSKNVNISLIK